MISLTPEDRAKLVSAGLMTPAPEPATPKLAVTRHTAERYRTIPRARRQSYDWRQYWRGQSLKRVKAQHGQL